MFFSVKIFWILELRKLMRFNDYYCKQLFACVGYLKNANLKFKFLFVLKI